MSAALVSIGRLMRPHGVRGFIKCKPYTHDLTRYKQLKTVFIESGSQTTELQVETASLSGDLWLLKFKGYETPESLKILVNSEICIHHSERIPPPEGEFYFSDLEGFQVVSESGELQGKVLAVREFPSVNAFLISLFPEQEIWIPWIDDCVLSINEKKKTITISLSFIEELIGNEL